MISIHKPYPDKERLLIESLHRYGEEAKRQKGLVNVYTLKDEEAGELIGLALWDSRIHSWQQSLP